MTEYFRVSPRIWLEPYSDDVRMLAFYLLTCRHRELEGLYLLPLAYAADDLRWEVGRLKSAMSFLIADEFCSYDEQARVVFIHKALAYQAPGNPNQGTHCLNAIDDIPDTPLLAEFVQAAKKFCTEGYPKTFCSNLEDHLKGRIQGFVQQPLGKPLQEPLSEALGKPIGHPPTPTPTPTTRKKRDSETLGDLVKEPFEDLWRDSGKIGSKEDARLAYLGWTSQGTSPEDLYTATMNYYRHCEQTDTAKKHLSTFLSHRNRQNQPINRWKEWLEEEHGSSDNGRRPRSASQRVIDLLARDESFEPRQIGAP